MMKNIGLWLFFLILIFSVASETHSKKGVNSSIPLLLEALIEEPDNAGILNNIALEYKSRGLPDSALFYLLKARDIAQLPEILSNLGNIYLTRGDTAAARRQYEMAIAKDPYNSYPLFNLASLHWQNKNIDTAQTLLKMAMNGRQFGEVSSHLPKSMRMESWMELWHSQAERFIKKSGTAYSGRLSSAAILPVIPVQTWIAPDPAEIYSVPLSCPCNDTGNVLYFIGKYEEAAFYYMRAIDSQPFCQSPRVNLALCFFKLGKTQKSLQEMEHYFFWKDMLVPDRESGSFANIYLNHFCGEFGNMEAENWLEAFEGGTQPSGSMAEVYYAYASVLEMSGNAQKAAVYFKKVLEEEPMHLKALESVSRAKYMQGDIDSGLRMLSHAFGSGMGMSSGLDIGFGSFIKSNMINSLRSARSEFERIKKGAGR